MPLTFAVEQTLHHGEGFRGGQVIRVAHSGLRVGTGSMSAALWVFQRMVAALKCAYAASWSKATQEASVCSCSP
jgi:hypothetical protein